MPERGGFYPLRESPKERIHWNWSAANALYNWGNEYLGFEGGVTGAHSISLPLSFPVDLLDLGSTPFLRLSNFLKTFSTYWQAFSPVSFESLNKGLLVLMLGPLV